MERVNSAMQKPIEQYSQLIRDLAGSNALSLTVVGAIVAGTFDKSRHTVRNVLVLSSIDLEFLKQLSLQGAKLGKVRISAPLIMTPDYIKASLDTFPLELIEIQQWHETLFGEDYFKDLSFEERHVRLQCEREIKTLLIGMRQGLLASGGQEKFIGAMEVDVTEQLIRTLRGVLWLKGKRESLPAPEVVSEIEGIQSQTFQGIRSAINPSGHHGWSEFQTLYKDVEVVGRLIDVQ